MPENDFLDITPAAQVQSSYIKVIGVGGAGTNAVNHMYNKGITGVDFIVCNTDEQSLNASPVNTKIKIGEGGLGAGNKPEVAQKAAVAASDRIKAAFDTNTHMLFIAAGMGGGTGTGASPEIAKIAKTYLHDAKEITIGTRNEGSENVNHFAYIVHAKDKYLALKRIVDYYPQIYGIVFCRTRMETQEIADKLIDDGYDADSLHGELSQAQRDLVMMKFRQRHLQLLVATDVAARGLDVSDLTHIINYGLPDDIEVYTHRSGRTGRAGKTGISIAIINMREQGKLRAIEKSIKKSFNISKLPSGEEICKQQLLKVIDDVEKVKVNEEEIANFLPDIYRKWEWLSKEDLIKRMVSLEFNRFLEYYSNAEEIESLDADKKKDRVREEKGRRKDRGSNKEKRDRVAEKGYTRIFITLGKKDGIAPTKIIDLINRNTKGDRVQVGRIDLMQNFSFFEVIESQANLVTKALNGISVKGRKLVVEVASENQGNSDKSGKKKSSEGKKSSRRDGDKGKEHKGKAERKKKSKDDSDDFFFESKNKKKDDWKQFFQGAAPEKKSKKKK